MKNLVDISASASIIASGNFIIAIVNPNKVKTAVCFDLLYNGTWGIVQITDMFTTSRMNDIFLGRFCPARRTVPYLQTCVVQVCVWTSLLLWLPGYTVSPFFCDMNSDSLYLTVYNQLFIISGWVVLVYNIYFMIRFTHTCYDLCKMRQMHRASECRGVEVVLIKGVIHCLSSSCANVFSSYNLDFGTLVYLVWVPVTLHFLFNCKIEAHLSRAISFWIKLRGSRKYDRRQSTTFSKRFIHRINVHQDPAQRDSFVTCGETL